MKFLKSKKSIVLLIVAVVLVVWAIDLMEDEAGASLTETIETRGSRILGTRLDVSGTQVDSGGGDVFVSGLVVANPGGFSDGNMISVDNVSVQLNPGTRIIERIGLAGVVALVEFRGAKNNFEELGNRIARGAVNDRPAGDPPEAEAGDQAEDSPGGDAGREPVADHWRIERVELDGIRVRVQADWTSEVMEYETDALLIEDLDAGTDDLARAVTVRFVDKVLVSAASQVKDSRLRERLMEAAGELRARWAAPE